MSLIGELQAYNLAFQHETETVLQDESETLIFERLNASTGLSEELVEIAASPICRTDPDGHALPPDVMAELRIAEELLAEADIAGYSAIKHGSRRYRVISPSPFSPQGNHRFWRFWITEAEQE